MSTRGFLAFAADGITKTAYNHSDSYPEGLGLEILQWVRLAHRGRSAAAVRRLRVVAPGSTPTKDDCARLARYYDPGVDSFGNQPTWYQLLRGSQGSPATVLHAGVIEDASTFPADSLWAEWGYVIDFDTQVLEVYAGFQRALHADGRYAAPVPDADGYYPARRVAQWPLDALPGDEEFVTAAYERPDDLPAQDDGLPVPDEESASAAPPPARATRAAPSLRRELANALQRASALTARLEALQEANEGAYAAAYEATGGPRFDPGRPFGHAPTPDGPRPEAVRSLETAWHRTEGDLW
ncbi:hypothetical protein ADL21_11325 [Streptomyces albus subsp. albus]|nr:hypothetical protein ADL21_11325 [Streptomyces albus subsp. albus]